jgi:hypothetical protein
MCANPCDFQVKRPKHDEIQDGAFGNAIRGSLGIYRGRSAVSGFMAPITH